MDVQRIPLRFEHEAHVAATHTNLSAVRTDGRYLWLAGDETATVERLAADDEREPRGYGEQRSFRLADFVGLPGDADEEADVEGLARQGDFLWAVGSHSLKRKQIKADHDDARGLARLAEVQDEANRRVLLRIPVVEDADGSPTLAAEATVDGEQVCAAVLGGRRKDSLTDLLDEDEHLAPFLAIPGKDNGFDAEGLAVAGDQLYLGLRGPVLRGWAVVLEVEPYVDQDKPTRLRLGRLDGGRERYRKHVLDLGGLGVRDLCPQGDDLLVLAGPTMDLDGPVRVYRWHDALLAERPEVVRDDELSRVLELPYGEGDDHAEGIALLGPADQPRLLVVYDSPAAERLTSEGEVLADLVPLPAA